MQQKFSQPYLSHNMKGKLNKLTVYSSFNLFFLASVTRSIMSTKNLDLISINSKKDSSLLQSLDKHLHLPTAQCADSALKHAKVHFCEIGLFSLVFSENAGPCLNFIRITNKKNSFSNFSCMFLNPNMFFQFEF